MRTIKLNVQGVGHVPSFKNSKMLVMPKGKRSRPLLITKPDFQAWMTACVDAFESQLRSEYQTTEAEMVMVRSLPSWIACVMPLDDSVNHISEITLRVIKVNPGHEGATIEVSRAW